MKTVLFVIESLHCGGAEKSLVTLLHNLDFKSLNVDLLLIKRGGEFEKFLPKEVTVIYHNSIETSGFLKRINAKANFYIKRRIPVNKKYNSAHTFWSSYQGLVNKLEKKYEIAIAYSQGFATYFVADKVNANKKFSWLNIDYNYAKHYAAFDYHKYKKFDSIVCVSKECKISLLKAMEEVGKSLPTTIIKDITDPKIVEKLSNEELGFDKEDEKSVILLTVCRLAKQKGLHLAVDACKVLVENGKNVKWYIIGVGTEKEFLEHKIKENNLQNHMVLMGFKENPYPYMRTCDIYVQTSLFEGLGLTVIEASILNKPIVTTNFPTAYTILKHNETGLIAEMEVNSIAEHIIRYIEDFDLVKKVQNQLREKDNESDKEVSLKAFEATIL